MVTATELGWGIRGQYGHESGAMVIGALSAVSQQILIKETLRRGASLR